MAAPIKPPRRKRSENLYVQRMRRLYDATLRCARALRGRDAAVLGTEIPALLDLRSGDRVVTSRITAAMRLLAGAEPDRRAKRPQKRNGPDSIGTQLGVALGLAVEAREQRSKTLVAVFAEQYSAAAWRSAFAVAAENKLPMLLFLVSGDRSLDAAVRDAYDAGIASMAVDATDAIAVYRVCQEAQARARIGDGPAFIACSMAAGSARHNPVEFLTRFFRQHQYAVDDWKRQLASGNGTSASRGRKARTTAAANVPIHILTMR